MRSLTELSKLMIIKYKQQVAAGCNRGLCKTAYELFNTWTISAEEYEFIMNKIKKRSSELEKSDSDLWWDVNDINKRFDWLNSLAATPTIPTNTSRTLEELLRIVLMEYSKQVRYGLNTGLCKVIGKLDHLNVITSEEYEILSDWLKSVMAKKGKGSGEYMCPTADTQTRIDLIIEHIDKQKCMAPKTAKVPVAPLKEFKLMIVDGEIMPMANQIAQSEDLDLKCNTSDPMLKLASDNSVNREFDFEDDDMVFTFEFEDGSELMLRIPK